jgi:hypothetical protein
MQDMMTFVIESTNFVFDCSYTLLRVFLEREQTSRTSDIAISFIPLSKIQLNLS